MKVQESQEVIDGAIHTCYTCYYCRSTQCPTSSLSIIKQKQTVKQLAREYISDCIYVNSYTYTHVNMSTFHLIGEHGSLKSCQKVHIPQRPPLA